jgi:hypothetical protein
VNSSPPRRATEVLRAGRGAQALGDAAQQHVSHGVSQGVVDQLEVVEIEEEDRAALAALERLTELGEEHGPVGQAGQLVVCRLLGERAERAHAFGDVHVDDQRAGRRGGRPADGRAVRREPLVSRFGSREGVVVDEGLTLAGEDRLERVEHGLQLGKLGDRATADGQVVDAGATGGHGAAARREALPPSAVGQHDASGAVEHDGGPRQAVEQRLVDRAEGERRHGRGHEGPDRRRRHIGSEAPHGSRIGRWAGRPESVESRSTAGPRSPRRRRRATWSSRLLVGAVEDAVVACSRDACASAASYAARACCTSGRWSIDQRQMGDER